MIVFKVRIKAPRDVVRQAHWTGPGRAAFMAETARDMGDQARVNIIKRGAPGGDWPKLSGYNAAGQNNAKIKKLLAASGKGGWARSKGTANKLDAERRRATSAARAQAKKHRTAERSETASGNTGRAGFHRAAAAGAKHAGYSRQKASGQTPGHGKFGADVRLRDTESMAAGMDGEIRGNMITMVSTGTDPSGVKNSKKFYWHATGAGNLPVRNPAEDMSLFEARLQERWRKFLERGARLE